MFCLPYQSIIIISLCGTQSAQQTNTVTENDVFSNRSLARAWCMASCVQECVVDPDRDTPGSGQL